MRAAGRRDLDEFFEDAPIADPRPATAQRLGRVVDGTGGQQRGKLLHKGSSSHDGITGTGTPVITKCGNSDNHPPLVPTRIPTAITSPNRALLAARKYMGIVDGTLEASAILRFLGARSRRAS
jgi:hypothetical protein